jgi:hypothetical protein
MSRSTESEHCPVCYADMTCQRDYMDGWALEEATEECPNGCWFYHYAYGVSEMYVTIRGHHISYGWGYGEDGQETRDTIHMLIQAAQRAQLEDYWNLVHGRSDQQSSSTG